MLDGLFRNCSLPIKWQKACKTLLNSAASDEERLAAILSALKEDCKLSPDLISLCNNPDLFHRENMEEHAQSPNVADFERDVIKHLVFGCSTLQEAIKDSMDVVFDSICRKAEGENQNQASLIRDGFAWSKTKISETNVVQELCQSGKIKIPPPKPFDLDAHLP
jgi:hypothetical protein